MKKFFSLLKDNSLEIITSVIGSLTIFWAMLFQGKLVGDLLDARFTVVVNDHWYQILIGNQNFTDLNIYFPTTNQLGYSDAFFATGITSIPFRLIGVTPIQSWMISNVLVVTFCLLIACKFFRIVLDNRMYAAFLALLIPSSYPFIAQMGHLQTVGYLLVFPIIYYLYRAYKDPSKAILNLFLFILFLQVLALTSWYAFVFTFAIGAILSGFSVLFFGVKEIRAASLLVFEKIRKNLAVTSNLKKVLIVSLLTPLPMLWISIYSVGFGQITNKNYGEFVFYAPRWGDLFNSVNQSWGPQKYFNDLTQQTIVGSFERALGVTPVVFLLSVLLVLLLIIPSSPLTVRYRKIVSILVSASVIPSFILVTDEEGHSLWRIIWILLEPIRSVRVPFRVSVITTWILLFAIFFVISRLKVKRVYVIGVFVLLLLDTWRPVPSTWSESEQISPSGRVALNSLSQQKCDYFFLNPSPLNETPWITQVEAMVIANMTGIPTVNGYSGNWPNGWPIQAYWGRATESEIKLWVVRFSTSRNLVGCFIEQETPHKVKII